MAGRGLSLGKVAAYCGVTRKTILRWVQEGMLSAFSLPSGHNRILPHDLIGFLRSNQMPIPPELALIDHRRTALICEDDPQIRRVIRDHLKKHFEVAEAADGIEACIKLGQLKPDLVTLDICMPGMDGLAVCRHIRQNNALKGTAIVIVSAHTRKQYPESLEELADAVVEKPFSPADLLHACQCALVGIPDKGQAEITARH